MISDQEKTRRLFDVNNALASQRLEGLEVDEATTADLLAYAFGEMDLKTARQRALARISTIVNAGTGDGD